MDQEDTHDDNFFRIHNNRELDTAIARSLIGKNKTVSDTNKKNRTFKRYFVFRFFFLLLNFCFLCSFVTASFPNAPAYATVATTRANLTPSRGLLPSCNQAAGFRLLDVEYQRATLTNNELFENTSKSIFLFYFIFLVIHY